MVSEPARPKLSSIGPPRTTGATAAISFTSGHHRRVRRNRRLSVLFFGYHEGEKRACHAARASRCLGSYTLRFQGLQQTDSRISRKRTALIEVLRSAGARSPVMSPAKLFFKRPQQPATKVAIRSTPFSDLYVVLAGIDDSGQTRPSKCFLKPARLLAMGRRPDDGPRHRVVMWPNVRERAAIATALRPAIDRTPAKLADAAPGGD